MADRLRVAVIGVGGIGIEHVKSVIACPRATVVALCESHPKRGREIAERYKIPRAYSDYRELLEQPDIDAVTIALPNCLHAPVALEAIQSRKHVFLEKPMATNAKDALKIAEAAKKSRLTVMVGQDFRFRPGTQLAKMLIDRNDLGEIYHTRLFWLRRSGIPRIGSWFTQKDLSGGGCTIDLGVHLIDTMMYLVGEFEAVSITAQTFAKFGPRDIGGYDWGKGDVDPRKTFTVEDNCVALLRLKSGRTASIDISWAGFHAPEIREYGLDLFGTNGGLSLYPARFFRNGANGYETVNLSTPKLPMTEDRIQHFVHCALDNKKPLISLDESVKVQQVLDAIYASAETGKEIRIK